MRSAIRTFAACLLMLLLPLQGFAAAAGLRAMNPCPMMSMMQDDCRHVMQHGDVTSDHAKIEQHGKTPQQDKSSCHMGMNCPAFGAPGMVSAGHLLSIDSSASLHAAIEPHDSSHTLEGLQRPPRQPA